MSANSSSGGYRRKTYQEDAYDHLGPRIRRALQEAVTGWDADWCLRMVRKYGADYVIKAIKDGDKQQASRTIQMKPGQKGFPSSYADKSCRVPILRANW